MVFSTDLATKRAGAAPDAIAPDGSEVRVLCATARGTMALFKLPPGAAPLEAVAVTMPPWPGADEADSVEGAWAATI